MTVNLENCNEIIAEFEFGKDYWLEDLIVEWEYGEGRYNNAKKLYTESLDSLVPVWEKLSTMENGGVWLNVKRHGVNDYHMTYFEVHNEKDSVAETGVTIQEAAAKATAKRILELTH